MLVLSRRADESIVIQPADGGTRVYVRVTMDGPLRAVWTAILGKGLKGSLQADLDRLVAVAESS